MTDLTNLDQQIVEFNKDAETLLARRNSLLIEMVEVGFSIRGANKLLAA